MSFVLFAFGEDWIIDGGLYNYEEKNPLRAHLRSHFAHSLSAPDNVEPVRRQKTHGGQNQIINFTSGRDRGHVEMEYKMFPGYLSHRSIELNRASESITINDRINPLQKEIDKSHHITRFLVPSDESVTWEKDKIVVHGSNHRMMIRSNKSLNRIFIESGQNFGTYISN